MNSLGCILVMVVCSTLTAAESVQLRNGGVMVGEVFVTEAGDVVVRTRFPKEAELVLSPEDITPASLYRIHERRADMSDPQALLSLAELASAAGLYGIAIGDYQSLKELDDEQGQLVDQRVAELTELLAEEVLLSAKALLEEDKVNAALLYLHTLAELYPRTAAGKEADTMMAAAHRRAGGAVEIAEDTVPLSRVQETLERILKNLGRGDAAREKAGGHVGSTIAASTQRRALDKAIRYYLRGWGDAKTLPAAIADEQTKSRVDGLRKRVKQKLVGVYLDAASLQLQRGSIPKAEEYCNAACELDPGNKASHMTHRLILEAKAYGF